MADAEIQEQEQVNAQKEYLMARISQLTDGIGPGYSEALMEELVSRLEKTVAEFHEEVTELMETLKTRAQDRGERLKTLMDQDDGALARQATEPTATAAEEEMSEWEKRLESKKGQASGGDEKGEEVKPEPEEEPKKKGLFGRKKKKKE